MTRDRLPLVAWLLMAAAAVCLIVAQLNPVSSPASADPGARTVVWWPSPTEGLAVVLVATETPEPTATEGRPTATSWPTDTPVPHCPQPSGECVWPWPSATHVPPRTPTPLPICSTPVPGLHCLAPTATPERRAE